MFEELMNIRTEVNRIASDKEESIQTECKCKINCRGSKLVLSDTFSIDGREQGCPQ